MAWTPPLTRHNSLSAQGNVLSCNVQLSKHNSPTFSRRCMKPTPLNNLNENVAEKALPQVRLDENIVITEHVPPNTNRLRKVLMYLEPKGCMKERDEYALYVFSPSNR